MSHFGASDIDYCCQHFTIAELRQQINASETSAGAWRLLGEDDRAECEMACVEMFKEAQTILRGALPKDTHTDSRKLAIADIKARASIVTIAERYTKLHKSASRFVGLCPLHDDRKSPSFTIYPNNQSWHCFGCGKGGDVFTLVMEAEGVDFIEAARRVADVSG